MTYFGCFGLVGKLKFHVCADKTWNRQYILENLPRLQVFLLNNFFSGSENQSQKLWDTFMKHNLLGFSLKKLKNISIKSPFPSLISVLWVSNLFAAWFRCNFQTINIDWRGKAKTYAKSSCLNIFCNWL